MNLHPVGKLFMSCTAKFFHAFLSPSFLAMPLLPNLIRPAKVISIFFSSFPVQAYIFYEASKVIQERRSSLL